MTPRQPTARPSSWDQALELLAQAGITGADAETSLQTFVRRADADNDDSIVTPAGRLLSPRRVSAELSRRYAHLPQAARAIALQDAYGADASRAAAVLLARGGGASS